MTAKIIWTLIFFCSIRGVYANAAKKEMAYELYHEEGFSIERIAKLVKQDRETVEQWLQEKTTA